MKVIRNHLLPLPGFAAINLFGLLLVRHDVKVDDEVLRHERIHTRQMCEMLFLPFYIWYICEWLIRLMGKIATLPYVDKKERRHHLNDAYAQMFFEREAYRHASEPDYLQHRRPYVWLIEPLLFSRS